MYPAIPLSACEMVGYTALYPLIFVAETVFKLAEAADRFQSRRDRRRERRKKKSNEQRANDKPDAKSEFLFTADDDVTDGENNGPISLPKEREETFERLIEIWEDARKSGRLFHRPLSRLSIGGTDGESHA